MNKYVREREAQKDISSQAIRADDVIKNISSL